MPIGTPSAPKADSSLVIHPRIVHVICASITALLGAALVVLGMMLLAVMSSSTDNEPSLALAGITIAFGLLLIAVLVGTLRARTVVDASGLHLRGPFGRQRNLTWEEARGRIWVNTITAHPFPITTSTIVVATDTKEVTLPSAVRQSLRRSSAERKAKELADRIIAMDPMTR